MTSVESVRGLRMLVTGASGTLGSELVRMAASSGAEVVASGRDPRTADRISCRAAHVIAADLADSAQCVRLVEQAADMLGGLDVLVNNAALNMAEPMASVRPEQLDEVWRVNLRAPFLLMRAASRLLAAGGRGSIVNVSSPVAASGGRGLLAPYAMTKAGLNALTKAAAREYGPAGIRVNAFYPPLMDSGLISWISAEYRKEALAQSTLGRPISVEEAAAALLRLAAPSGAPLTGTIVDASAMVP